MEMVIPWQLPRTIGPLTFLSQAIRKRSKIFFPPSKFSVILEMLGHPTTYSSLPVQTLGVDH